MRIYISGKITGLPEEEYKQNFEIAEQTVRDKYRHLQVQVINPCKIVPRTENPQWEDYMAADIEELLKCKAVYMLKNWGDSRGARVEYQIARELGLPIEFEQ